MIYYDRQKDEHIEVPNEKAYLGQCFGVVITPRRGYGPLFTIIVEDDGNWFTSEGCADVHWLADLAKVIAKARRDLAPKRKAK